ncbi:MAG: Beta-galactosidase [Chloroflexi bacterium]|jgi:hypothetical protein|nr:Beta-galactosidase [Chloroflexota bacterium]
MPFLTQQRSPGLSANCNFEVTSGLSQSDISQPDMRWSGEGWLNLNHLQLQPAIDRQELTFSLEAEGKLVAEEIYWLQTEILLKNEAVWRGEVGVFYDEGMPNVQFLGSIPLPADKFWSPENPNLYNLRLTLFKGAYFLDRVEIYFGIRQESGENGAGYLIYNCGWGRPTREPQDN